jgi:hypothetical protein
MVYNNITFVITILTLISCLVIYSLGHISYDGIPEFVFKPEFFYPYFIISLLSFAYAISINPCFTGLGFYITFSVVIVSIIVIVYKLYYQPTKNSTTIQAYSFNIIFNVVILCITASIYSKNFIITILCMLPLLSLGCVLFYIGHIFSKFE